MRVEQEFQPKGKGQPFAIYFVYPKIGEPFIVKGNPDKVREFVDFFSYNIPCFYRYTYWGRGTSRGNWKTGSNKWWICKSKDKKRGYEITGTKTNKRLYLRKMPNRWIHEFDDFV